ncbi:MAG: YibE/F family protein [Eubacteriaceae bacterium]
MLYAGYMNLDFNAIFQAGVYIACSGDVLDLAIDISAAIEEVVWNNPKVSKDQLIKQGLTIGKSAVGGQITTLLLAYMAQGVLLMNIINSKAIEAEILNTFVGCVGLVLV